MSLYPLQSGISVIEKTTVEWLEPTTTLHSPEKPGIHRHVGNKSLSYPHWPV